jgi:hypothetical protein
VTSKRITEITVETIETVAIRRSRCSTEFRCSQCGSPAMVLGQDTADSPFWTRLREVCGATEAKQIHAAKTADGSSIICLDSLRRATRQFPTTNEWNKENES